MPEVGNSRELAPKKKLEGAEAGARNVPYKIVGTHFLDQLSEGDILRDISLRIEHKSRLIIPIGLPQAGKSMFIASLIGYAFGVDDKEDNSCNFRSMAPHSVTGIQTIIDALDNKSVLPATRPGEMTIIDLKMESCYRKQDVKVSLIDFSGEDIQSLISGNSPDNQETVEKINKILAACIARKAIFAILTPVDEKMTDVTAVSQFDKDEAASMKSFINFIENTNRKLFLKTKFLITITKWDKLPEYMAPSKYLQNHRKQLYNEYKSNKKSYGLLPYSVGNVVGDTIINIDLHSPKNFWYTLYRWTTGLHVLPWWKRWFS